MLLTHRMKKKLHLNFNWVKLIRKIISVFTSLNLTISSAPYTEVTVSELHTDTHTPAHCAEMLLSHRLKKKLHLNWYAKLSLSFLQPLQRLTLKLQLHTDTHTPAHCANIFGTQNMHISEHTHTHAHTHTECNTSQAVSHLNCSRLK